jgi:intermediate peptidase
VFGKVIKLSMKFKEIFKTSLLKPTGLFGYRILQSENGFGKMADYALAKSEKIVESVIGSNSSADQLQTVKRLDKLSDLLCSVIDSAQLIQFVHPDDRIRKSASDAFKKLSTYLNSLNTNLELYLKLKNLIQDPDLSQHLSSQEKIVGKLLLKDFEKSGINMKREKKDLFVQYHDRIMDLGDKFMSTSYSQGEDLIIPSKALIGIINSSQKYVSVNPNSKLAHLILHQAKDSNLRKKMFIAMNTATKEQIDTFEQLLEARSSLANLLNEQSYSHMFLKDKMARTPGK